MKDSHSARLLEVTKLFFKLGLTAFGGPAAHVAIMHDEVVKRRKWLTDQEFLDLLGATNLIPGPNSTEMAIHLGFVRAGWPGLIAGGLGFIIPAALIVLVLAWAYARFGALPQAGWLLYGVKPVVIAIILQALWHLGSKALRSVPTGLAAAAAFGLYFLGVNEIALLFAGGLAVMAVTHARRLRQRLTGTFLLLPGSLGTLLAANKALMAAATPFNLPLLFWTFLKIGSVLYGSGYVLLAFLRADLVVRYGWLTDAQLLDAIAIGQVTPGPLFTTATFIGYQLAGIPGAILASFGIFLPSFAFVAISNPFIPRLRASPWLGALLDGVNAASLGLMAAVTVLIGRASLVDPLTVAIAFVSLLLLLRFKVNSTWLIIAGILIGILAGTTR
ncbi:MAG: chromate efflux transporter [Chloroflexota bacterium]